LETGRIRTPTPPRSTDTESNDVGGEEEQVEQQEVQKKVKAMGSSDGGEEEKVDWQQVEKQLKATGSANVEVDIEGGSVLVDTGGNGENNQRVPRTRKLKNPLKKDVEENLEDDEETTADTDEDYVVGMTSASSSVESKSEMSMEDDDSDEDNEDLEIKKIVPSPTLSSRDLDVAQRTQNDMEFKIDKHPKVVLVNRVSKSRTKTLSKKTNTKVQCPVLLQFFVHYLSPHLLRWLDVFIALFLCLHRKSYPNLNCLCKNYGKVGLSFCTEVVKPCCVEITIEEVFRDD